MIVWPVLSENVLMDSAAILEISQELKRYSEALKAGEQHAKM